MNKSLQEHSREISRNMPEIIKGIIKKLQDNNLANTACFIFYLLKMKKNVRNAQIYKKVIIYRFKLEKLLI